MTATPPGLQGCQTVPRVGKGAKGPKSPGTATESVSLCERMKNDGFFWNLNRNLWSKGWIPRKRRVSCP